MKSFLLTSCIISLILISNSYSQNTSLYFDGISAFAKTNQVAAASDNFTIELWAKPTGKDSIVNEGVNGTGGIRIALHPPHGDYNWGTGHAGAGVTVATNTITVYEHANNYLQARLVWVGAISGWNHIAVVYENKTPKLYVNGTLVRTGLTSSYVVHPSLGYDGRPSYTANNGIGAGMNGGYYQGYLDEIRISDNVRYTANFIPQKEYANDQNTIGLFHFNEGSGNTANDASSLINNGTIFGATWSNDVPVVVTSVMQESSHIIKNFLLFQNYPNPFNPNTVISYSLPSALNVKLIVYNTLGQTVKILENGFKIAGNYSINFNASKIPSGIYFYKLETGQFSQIKKMILLK
jgi:hypothetical protein